ncbi:MAG: hypothetical protein ACOCQX_00870 [Candidatus Nanoarchaeia archaeon]
MQEITFERIVRDLAYDATIRKNLKTHPWEHTERVLSYSKDILENEYNHLSIYKEITVASLFHDVGRLRDGKDIEHGYRSALILDNMLPCFPFYFDVSSVRYAILNHSREEGDVGKYPIIDNFNTSVDKRIVACLWDADRLDLTRLKEFPNVNKSYLSTEYGKCIADLINAGVG